MELPTYTSIWRIEKRLYKLYDFRLPMPLPVGQIAVFTAITLPYVILLTLLGLPFNHTLFWLYVLPPGLLTWLATRPVLESKRLPELIASQLRYLGEPSTWCRMAPLAEKDEILVTGRVWRRAHTLPGVPDVTAAAPERAGRRASRLAARRPVQIPERAAPAQAALPQAQPTQVRVPVRAPVPGPALGGPALGGPAHGGPALPAGGGPPARAAAQAAPPAPADHGVQRPARQRARHAMRPAARWPPEAGGRVTPPPAVRAGEQPLPPGPPPPAPEDPPRAAPPRPVWPEVPAPQLSRRADPELAPVFRAADPEPPPAEPVTGPPREPAEPSREPTSGEPTSREPTSVDSAPRAGAQEPVPELAHEVEAKDRAAPPPSQVVIVPAQRPLPGEGAPRPAAPRPAPAVERALGGPGERHTAGWRSHVTVVPGGHGPGRPDPRTRAKERAALPLDGPRLVVVLGCTVGAGQTVTTLMLADLLASLRGEPIAALDLNPGPASLTALAHRPATTASELLATRGSPGHPAHAAPPARRAPRGPRPTGRLDVICDDSAAANMPVIGRGTSGSVRPGRLLDILGSRYGLTLADPGAAAVGRVLSAADGLVLVAPASPDAPRAVGMTLEWLGAHGYGPLSAQAVAVINGVSHRSVSHAEQAGLVLKGRCRAIVRVPWDDHLAEPQSERGIRESLAAPSSGLARLRPAVLQACTALAGVLVSGLAASSGPGSVAR